MSIRPSHLLSKTGSPELLLSLTDRKCRFCTTSEPLESARARCEYRRFRSHFPADASCNRLGRMLQRSCRPMTAYLLAGLQVIHSSGVSVCTPRLQRSTKLYDSSTRLRSGFFLACVRLIHRATPTMAISVVGENYTASGVAAFYGESSTSRSVGGPFSRIIEVDPHRSGVHSGSRARSAPSGVGLDDPGA